jgi:uncharacterized lipoprotein YajG
MHPFNFYKTSGVMTGIFSAKEPEITIVLTQLLSAK